MLIHPPRITTEPSQTHRTKHIVACFYKRVKLKCLNDVNDDKHIQLIATFVAESIVID